VSWSGGARALRTLIVPISCSAFFWLVSFLLSSLVWFAVYPLRDSNIWFALVFTVIFQELMRVAFFYMLK
jgi:anterior pharynx defective protein 1